MLLFWMVRCTIFYLKKMMKALNHFVKSGYYILNTVTYQKIYISLITGTSLAK
jgi:hypothetical protein